MDNQKTDALKNIILAPYLQIATALIGKSRRIGGNQFRHVWATLGILVDHKVIESVILKASVLHDLKEDAPFHYFPEQIRNVDEDGAKVVELIEELSIRENEPKSEYLLRVMSSGTREAKLIKLADRISNLTDIQLGTFDIRKVQKTLNETQEYILPYAKDINENMYNEIVDLISTRTKYVHRTIELIVEKVINDVVEKINNFDSESRKLVTVLIENIFQDVNLFQSLPNEIQDELGKNITKNIKEFENLASDTLLKFISGLSSDFVAHDLHSRVYFE